MEYVEKLFECSGSSADLVFKVNEIFALHHEMITFLRIARSLLHLEANTAITLVLDAIRGILMS